MNASRRAFTAEARPFNILGLQQVAIGALDKQQLANFWVDALGVPKIGTFKSEVSLIESFSCEILINVLYRKKMLMKIFFN